MLAGTLGHALECYDFALYAFLSPILATVFFPNQDEFICACLVSFWRRDYCFIDCIKIKRNASGATTMKKIYVVTGASSGIGYTLCSHLARRHEHIIAIARREA